LLKKFKKLKKFFVKKTNIDNKSTAKKYNLGKKKRKDGKMKIKK